MNNHHQRNKSRAFTLIELLVVIDIIGILTSLLLPDSERAKAIAKRSHCANNLQQINLAARMYFHNYEDFLPPPAFFHPEDRWGRCMMIHVFSFIEWDGVVCCGRIIWARTQTFSNAPGIPNCPK